MELFYTTIVDKNGERDVSFIYDPNDERNATQGTINKWFGRL